VAVIIRKKHKLLNFLKKSVSFWQSADSTKSFAKNVERW